VYRQHGDLISPFSYLKNGREAEHKLHFSRSAVLINLIKVKFDIHLKHGSQNQQNIPGFKAVLPVRSQQAFRRNMWPPSSWLKSKPSKNAA
jgi:hypothetical protein